MARRASSPARRSLMVSRRSRSRPPPSFFCEGACAPRPRPRLCEGAPGERECSVAASDWGGVPRDSSCPARPAATKRATSCRQRSWTSGAASAGGGLRRRASAASKASGASSGCGPPPRELRVRRPRFPRRRCDVASSPAVGATWTYEGGGVAGVSCRPDSRSRCRRTPRALLGARSSLLLPSPLAPGPTGAEYPTIS
jgi:hypothetical protein